MSVITNKQIEKIKLLSYDAFYSAEKAHEILFKDTRDYKNQMIASTLLNKSISYMSAAIAIYYSNYEELENESVENVFNKFTTFESEFLNNLATDHSHQWTDIEFRNFKEAYDFSGLKLGE